jgi:ubiquinone/menaquinone biosynthesis C-methylase UbiE
MDSDSYYKTFYSKVLSGGIVGYVAGLYHKKLEAGRTNKFENVLEIGAGAGEHYKFVKHAFSNYLETDIRGQHVINQGICSSKNGKISNLFLDAHDLSAIKSESIDRLIVTCVLPHLLHPESALIEWRRVLKIGGVIDMYVPCEPSLLLRIAQRFTTKRRVNNLGLNYELIQYREHRNHFPMMRLLIKETFYADQISWYGFPLNALPWDLQLYVVVKIKKIK